MRYGLYGNIEKTQKEVAEILGKYRASKIMPTHDNISS